MFKTITDYKEINLKNGALLIFDIDETIMKFDGISAKWWKTRFEHHYKIMKDYDNADQTTLKEWIEHVHINRAQLIDKESFFDIIHKSHHDYNCEIIFITARPKDLKNITEKHFNECDTMSSRQE